MSTVKQFGTDEITGRRDGDGARRQRHASARAALSNSRPNSLVLAVGEHADLEFLKPLPGIRIGRGDVVEVDEQMGTGHPGIFAGGDMIGGARTMTAAVGHGKKAARNIDAWLRGARLSRNRRSTRSSRSRPSTCPCSSMPSGASRRKSPAHERIGIRGGRRRISPSPKRDSRLAAALSCGNCFECDNCYAACPGAGHRQARQGPLLPLRLRPVHGLCRVFRAVPLPCDRNDARSPRASRRRESATLPAKFKARP